VASLVGIGRLFELVVRVGGTDHHIRPRGKWLCWCPSSRDLLVGTREGKTSLGSISRSVESIHRRFHAAAPRSASIVEIPRRAGARPVGLLVSLTYVVPKDIESPQKNSYNWIHWFGDHGERGHGEATDAPVYPARYMPMLMQKGSDWFIKRRKGNRYVVTDWLYW
jgi:hypothetical protein